MKNLIFLIALLLIISCSSTNDHMDIKSRIATVSNDPLFHEYSNLIRTKQESIINHDFDLHAIRDLKEVGKWPDCKSDFSHLANVKGCEVYFMINCKSQDVFTKLKIKYPDIFTGDIEIMKQLVVHYNMNNADQQEEKSRIIENALKN